MRVRMRVAARVRVIAMVQVRIGVDEQICIFRHHLPILVRVLVTGNYRSIQTVVGW